MAETAPASDALIPALGAPATLTPRIVLRSLWRALPELGLINSQIWTVSFAAAWSVVGLLHLAGWIVWPVWAFAGLGALWLTAVSIRMAIVNRDDL